MILKFDNNFEENYQEIIEDMYKIYLYCIDSNNVKKFQTINNKYTTTDMTMIAAYIFLELAKREKISKKEITQVIGNAFVKNLINYSTGNFEVDIKDNTQIKIYDKVKENVCIEKIKYLNRILRKLKIKIEEIKNPKVTEIFIYSQQITEIFILIQVYLNGNEFAYEKIIEKVKKLKIEKSNLNDMNKLFDEILTEIDNKKNILKILKRNNIYNLISVIFNLRDVYRFSQVNLIVPENVLFHTYVNSVMAYIMCDYLNSFGENIDEYDVITKILFHDFSEYSGNEIISSMKIYSQETHNLFEKIESEDEESLNDLIGKENYDIVKSYKDRFSGYVSEIIDKISGIMKILIEVKYYNNLTLLKVFSANECKRFEKFYNYEKIEDSKNRYFYTNLLKLHYIYIIENFLKKEDVMATYFNKFEIDDIRKSIEREKERIYKY